MTELGITFTQPYGGYSWYLSDAQYTENSKFAYVGSLFPRVRMISNTTSGAGGLYYPQNGINSLHIWASYLKTINPNCYLLYGTTNNTEGFNAARYAQYTSVLLQEAQWAQDNLMDAFCIGNENLINLAHITLAMTIATNVRTSNVATATFASAHGLTTGDKIFVTGATASSFNVADSESSDAGVACTVIDSLTVTYPSTGTNGAASVPGKMNWTAYEVVRKTKALAVLCQAIFTRGPIVYSESQGHYTPWINNGITPGVDIDLIAANGYGSGSNEANFVAWKTEADAMFSAFGAEKLIFTEMNVVQDSGNVIPIGNYNKTHKGVQWWWDQELARRYNYLKDLGITQIYIYGAQENPFFCNSWPNNTYNNAYFEGEFKPVIRRLMGKRINKVFFGTFENNITN